MGLCVNCPIDTAEGIVSMLTHPKQMLKSTLFLLKATVFGNIYQKERNELNTMINTAVQEWGNEYGQGDSYEKGEKIGELIGQALLLADAIAGPIDDFINSGKFASVFEEAANAVNVLKAAIKNYAQDLGDLIKNVYTDINGEVELEYAGIGRMKFNEADLIGDADLTCQQRFYNFLESKWAETEGASIDDTAEALMDGQQYTKSGRIKVLKPNITYLSNGYTYVTDEFGRINSVEGDLVLNEAPRNEYAQRMAGRVDRLTTDDGGHLIGSQFNGSGNIDNLVPIDSNINRAGGKWYQMEQEWKAALDAGEKVNVKIESVYSGISQRPISFNVKYTIEGENPRIVNILNQAGG